MEDTGRSETTVREHNHYCTFCHDLWSHQVEECDPGFVSRLFATEASCPIHEGETHD